jgi:hypothetical protein
LISLEVKQPQQLGLQGLLAHLEAQLGPLELQAQLGQEPQGQLVLLEMTDRLEPRAYKAQLLGHCQRQYTTTELLIILVQQSPILVGITIELETH